MELFDAIRDSLAGETLHHATHDEEYDAVFHSLHLIESRLKTWFVATT